MKKRNIILSGVIALTLCFTIALIVIRTFVYPLDYKEIILNNSSKYNLDPYLVFAVINAESNFDKNATSSKNAKGLMQITDSTAKEMNDITSSTENLNGETIYDENINIELGCKYLSSLISRYNGNYYIAICAYNAGIGNVNNWLDEGVISQDLNTVNTSLPFSETTNYLKKVISNYEVYKLIYPQLNK